MKSSSTNFYKVLKGYENYFLNANIDYKKFLNLNSDEVVEDLYTAFNTSKTNCATIEPNWYKQIFLEIEDYAKKEVLFILTISYSTATDTFRIEINNMKVPSYKYKNDTICHFSMKSEPDKNLFKQYVELRLLFISNKCKEILQKEN